MGFKYNSNILNEEECKFISNYILKNEDRVKSLGPDVYSHTSEDSLSGRHTIFNWLNTDIGDILVPKLRTIFNKMNLDYPISINCWANTFRKGEGIKPHFHSKSDILCGHIFISGPTDIGTRYLENGIGTEDVLYKNNPGELNLFSADLWHAVDENKTDEVRVTMAMDIFVGEDRNFDKNRYYVMEEI